MVWKKYLLFKNHKIYTSQIYDINSFQLKYLPLKMTPKPQWLQLQVCAKKVKHALCRSCTENITKPKF